MSIRVFIVWQKEIFWIFKFLKDPPPKKRHKHQPRWALLGYQTHLYWSRFHGCRWPIWFSMNLLATGAFTRTLCAIAHHVKHAGVVLGHRHSGYPIRPLHPCITVWYKRLSPQEPGQPNPRLALSRPLQWRTGRHEAAHPSALPGPGCDMGSLVSVGPADASDPSNSTVLKGLETQYFMSFFLLSNQ